MKKKLGRPSVPSNEYKGDVFSVRVTGDEAKAIWETIKESGKTKPVWLREVLNKAVFNV